MPITWHAPAALRSSSSSPPCRSPPGVAEVAAALGEDASSFATRGGEDYELCFCASPASRHAVEAALAELSVATPVTWIGEVRGSGPAGRAGVYFRDRSDQRAGLTGYEHSF